MLKTLIIYGSRKETTQDCARLIYETMDTAVEIVDVTRAIPAIDNFDRFIIGANAFCSRLNRNIIRFIEKNQKILLKKELFLFICSGSQEEKQIISLFHSSYPLEIINHARSLQNFGGKLILKKEPWHMRLVLKLMKKSDYNTINTEAVKLWAGNILLQKPELKV